MKPAVLVTGGTGFIGGSLVSALARAGHSVHVMARPEARRDLLAGVPCEIHAGDVTSAQDCQRVLQAVARVSPAFHIVHAAAVISYHRRDAELQRRVNVEGTRHLLSAASRTPPLRWVHVSSVVTVGHTRAQELGDEEWPYNGVELGCDYVDTKREAEELVLDAAANLDVVVVNPGAVFGPNPRGGNTVKFLRRLAGGGVGPWAPPGSLSVVGVEDVASGCVLALERGLRGRRYLLVESARSTLEVFGVAAHSLGVSGPRWRVPRGIWSCLEPALRALELVHDPSLLTAQTAVMMGAHFRFSGQRARRELGWTPAPFEDVMNATVRWLRAERGASL